jgi:hypothetical protein
MSWNSIVKNYYSMFNCNQNYHRYKKILSINYGFKDLILKQIISQFQWKQFVGLCKTQQALKFINYLTHLSRFHIHAVADPEGGGGNVLEAIINT